MPPSQYLPFTACMKFVLFKKHSSIDNLLSPAWPTLSLFLLWAPTVDEATHHLCRALQRVVTIHQRDIKDVVNVAAVVVDDANTTEWLVVAAVELGSSSAQRGLFFVDRSSH